MWFDISSVHKRITRTTQCTIIVPITPYLCTNSIYLFIFFWMEMVLAVHLSRVCVRVSVCDAIQSSAI